MKNRCTRKDYLFALSAAGLGGCALPHRRENVLVGGMVRDCVRDGLYLALACAFHGISSGTRSLERELPHHPARSGDASAAS